MTRGGMARKSYPANLPQREELEFAGGTFNTGEINGSFDSLQLPNKRVIKAVLAICCSSE